MPEYSRLARRETKSRRDRRDRFPEPRSSAAEGPLPADSDLEDLISLGDVEEHTTADLPMLAPGDTCQDSDRHHKNSGLSIRGRGHAKQRALRSDWTDGTGPATQREGALAIRGASRSKGAQRGPDLLQRLSVRPAPISPVEGGYRSAKVGNDLRQKLMARLEEEKSRSAPTVHADGDGDVKDSAQVREDPTNGVAAKSDANQPDAAPAQRRMADLRARLLAERKSVKDASSVTPVDRMAALKAKLKAEKEMRLAQEGA